VDPCRPAVRAVVDTDVIACFLLGTEGFRDECERFWRAVDEVIAPASWEAEITNVLWMATRKQVIDLPEALHRLELAKGLGIRSIAVNALWSGALVRAHTAGIAAHDALFVELADREGVPLATFDEPLIKAFPRHAMRPRRVQLRSSG
jgi:predicted nucleic acid-binding protein